MAEFRYYQGFFPPSAYFLKLNHYAKDKEGLIGGLIICISMSTSGSSGSKMAHKIKLFEV